MTATKDDGTVESVPVPAVQPWHIASAAPRCPDLDETAEAASAACHRFGITRPIEVAAFMAQCAWETSEFRLYSEQLDYRPAQLMATWPGHFPPDNIRLANRYAHQPEALANFVYANRLGNGDEASGDGWRYRGGGALQATGKDRYATLATALGLPLVEHPELLREPPAAFLAAAHYWVTFSDGLTCHQHMTPPNDMDLSVAFRRITRLINGGYSHHQHRVRYFEAFRKAMGC